MSGDQVVEHLLHIRGAGSTAMTSGRGGTRSHLRHRVGTLADCLLDRPVFDVVASADGLESPHGRMHWI